MRKSNEYRIEGDRAYIKLTKGKETVISVVHLALVLAYRWQTYTSNGTYYAATWTGHTKNGSRRFIVMHRLILGLEAMDPREGDHINRNALDNRRENLRITDRSGNMLNRSVMGATPFRGVCKNRKSKRHPYLAQIRLGDKVKNLRYHPTAEQAALTFDLFSLTVRGEAIKGLDVLNFQESAEIFRASPRLQELASLLKDSK